MTDKNTLDLARDWAKHAKTLDEISVWPTALAAAEVIQSLPDEWVDASELRYAISAWEFSNIPAAQFVDMVRDTLPTPPAPRNMAEIEWSDEEHHLAEATAAWTEGHPSNVVMLNKFGKKITVYQSASHYSGLRELNPGILTPTGRKYRLIPDEGVPEGDPIETDDDHASHCASCAEMDDDEPDFDPDYIYRDKDGDKWEYIDGGWIYGDTHAKRVDELAMTSGRDTLPAWFGPYTRIEEEEANE